MTDTSKRTEIEWEQLYPTVEVSRNATGEAEKEEESAAVEEDGLSPGVAMEAKDEEGDAEEEGEEGREAVAMPSPMTPSRREREQHELTHTPYRSWCPHCVRARGRNRAHLANKDPEKPGVPRISFDYFFFSDEDEKSDSESYASHG